MAKSGPKPATPIETNELCSHGCGRIAKFVNKSGKYLCENTSNKCPSIIKKNSDAMKAIYDDGTIDPIDRYANLPEETKNRMAWNRGLTKETDARVLIQSKTLIGRPGTFSGKTHRDETRKQIAAKRTEWLKKSENRKNLGRHKKSWMEEIFEQYLNDNCITGWESEKHFWSEELRRNYYPDFIFEDHKLIIELDGTQHRNSVEHDRTRDSWFNQKGYTVIRVEVSEFKLRHFSGKGFMDILPKSVDK